MKKVLFVINNLNMGGIQTSLLELLKKLVEKYDITLFCIRGGGVIQEFIPREIRMIEADMPLRLSEMSRNEACECGASSRVLFFLMTAWCRLFSRKYVARILAKHCQTQIGDFDVAVSFTQPIQSKAFFNLSNEVVLYSCKSKKTITFVHCDFLSYGGNDSYNRKMYELFDVIAAVSDSVGERIAQAIPAIKGKITTVFNCSDLNEITNNACDRTIEYEEEYPVISVCRCTKEKGLPRCVEVMANLISKGYDIKWHIVGDGEEVSMIKTLSAKFDIQDKIIIHGMQKNPYRYMKNAKLLFLPSFHEAAPMVFNEARALNIPVLTTDTLSANEMIAKSNSGWVVKNDVADIQAGLINALEEIRNGYKVQQIDDRFFDRGVHQFVELVEKQ